MIERLKLRNFTAFKELDMEFAPGVNLFIGENGTGKTHILKVMYVGLNVSSDKKPSVPNMVEVFLPYGYEIGRLVHRDGKKERAEIEIRAGSHSTRLTFTFKGTGTGRGWGRGEGDGSGWGSGSGDGSGDGWGSGSGSGFGDGSGSGFGGGERIGWVEAGENGPPLTYIPVKEMLANAPGFLSLYELRKIHFEKVYPDLLLRAFLGPLRELPSEMQKLMIKLQKQIGGTVVIRSETFFLKNKQGELEFDLLAEGLRKLGLLWLLIQNGCLSKGSVLFWDEPEANLNPALLEPLVDILLELERLGVQMFIATHEYALLKLFDLKKKDQDAVRFFSLRKDKDKGVAYTASEGYLGTLPNKIDEASERLFVMEVEKGLKGARQ